MKKMLGILLVILFLWLLCSPIFVDVADFFAWLFMLQYSAPETSLTGGRVVRLLTFIVSFGLVGIIFNVFSLFNSKLMSFAYAIISILAGFVLACVVKAIETHILIIGIVLGVISLGIIAFFVVTCLISKKNKTKDN